MSKTLITFAGPIGSSKTPIAHHIGWNFGFPVFNTDIIRSEIKENSLSDTDEFFLEFAKSRLLEAFELNKVLILDASIDRIWGDYKNILSKYNFNNVFIISMDISLKLLKDLYKKKNYQLHDENSIIQNYNEHQEFLKEYGTEVSLSINDDNFSERLDLAKNFIKLKLNL